MSGYWLDDADLNWVDISTHAVVALVIGFSIATNPLWPAGVDGLNRLLGSQFSILGMQYALAVAHPFVWFLRELVQRYTRGKGPWYRVFRSRQVVAEWLAPAMTGTAAFLLIHMAT